ncbi:MAG: prolipoprotein diacylglyceryl transferase [Betaproteobacteria bacterium]|nr:prolipoprotein diacylglyceryl transferase [Betaproteobacteria bacterium]
MLTYPHIDPIAFSLGPLSVRWYGLMYLAGFVAFVVLGRRRISQRPDLNWTAKDIDDLLFYGVIGVVIGGRLGQVLFYEPGHYLAHPLEIFAVWKGGMAFHGGFLGVLAAMMLYARKRGLTWLAVMDFIAPLVPPGLGFGRIGNFINGELWGRAADPSLPWAMVFPHVDSVARHPSQLYQAFLEGIVLFGVLWWFSAKPRATGAVSGLFLIGYGVVRFVAEFFREPDAGIFGLSYTVSMGQWLSLPMIAAGVAMMLWANRARQTR